MPHDVVLCRNIVMITLIVYICEIIYYKHIPLFVMLTVTGQPIMGIVTDCLFKMFEKSSWRYSLLVIVGIGFAFYIFVIYIIEESPLYYLNNGDVKNFQIALTIISMKNKKVIVMDEFAFVYEAMKTNINFEKENDNNNLLPKPEQQHNNEGNDDNKQQLIQDNNNNAPVDLSTTIFTDVNKDTGSMFGKYKMKDYTPLDLLRYKSQIKNFLILSLLWSVIFHFVFTKHRTSIFIYICKYSRR